jgi:hypothetical protein
MVGKEGIRNAVGGVCSSYFGGLNHEWKFTDNRRMVGKEGIRNAVGGVCISYFGGIERRIEPSTR